jgi:hypothetical protein
VDESQNTLRDALEASFDEVDAGNAQEESSTPQVSETAEQRESRERDERGRFAPKAADTSQPMAEAPQVPRPPRPSSWKKDYWDDWDKLDPKVAGYLHQREQEYTTGVSTYKAEADRARGLQEALNPYMPVLQSNNLEPAQWIKSLGQVHYTLAFGQPQEKAALLKNLARDFNVQLGETNENEELMHLRNELQQVKSGWQQFSSMQEQQQKQAAMDEITRFSADKQYFEEVRETMAGLLQSGMAQNLQEAYEKAVRLNDDVFTRHQAETQRQTQAQAHVAKAKAAAVSVKSSTPGGPTVSNGAKGLRDQLSEAFDSFSSRV